MTKSSTLGKYVTAVLIFFACYVAWCWAAKLIWNTDPPEGLSLAALVTTSAELLGCSLLQAVKKVSTAKSAGEDTAKELKALRAENAKLKRAVDKASDQLKLDT